MPHQPTKKEKIEGHHQSAAAFGDLEVGVLAHIYGFLDIEDITRSRRIDKKSGEAVKLTIVPPSDFWVNSMEKYNAVNAMTRAMPNLQQIELRFLGNRHKCSDGEDPDEDWAHHTADWITYDIEIISNFSKLRDLKIWNVELNGRYPFLFNSFPLLQILSIRHCTFLKWDLEMLAGLPLLKELDCINNYHLTGNINSLRVLKDTLEKVKITGCFNVEGSFMDLADFPHLKMLDLDDTAVTGDIRDIGEKDFSLLEELSLPVGVYGGRGYEFQRISDGPELIRTVYLFKKQRPTIKFYIHKYWDGKLSEDSPDWYGSLEGEEDDNFDSDDTPPFHITIVEAGSRIGYRWETEEGNPCEVNWLDPEPDRDSSDYEIYSEELQTIEEQVTMYRGFYQPPTEEEYQRVIRVNNPIYNF